MTKIQGRSTSSWSARVALFARLILYASAVGSAVVLIGLLSEVEAPHRIDLSLGSRYPLAAAPIPLQLAWVSGAVGWTVLLSCLAVTGTALVLDRRNRARVEPLALIAITLGVLGCSELIAGIRAMNTHGAWPVNLLYLGIEILFIAGFVSVLALVRIAQSKGALPGRALATITVLYCGGLVWGAYDALYVRLIPLPVQDGIELPQTSRFRGYAEHDDLALVTLRVRVDGVLVFPDGSVHEPGGGQESLIEKLAEITEWYPCGTSPGPVPLQLRVDSAARWGRIHQLLLALHSDEIRVWLIELAVEGHAPRCATSIGLDLGCGWGLQINDSSPIARRDLFLRIGDGLALDDVPVSSLEELTRLADRTIDTTFTDEKLSTLIIIVPEPDVPWSDLVAMIDVAQSLERLALARDSRSLGDSVMLQLDGSAAWLD